MFLITMKYILALHTCQAHMCMYASTTTSSSILYPPPDSPWGGGGVGYGGIGAWDTVGYIEAVEQPRHRPETLLAGMSSHVPNRKLCQRQRTYM